MQQQQQKQTANTTITIENQRKTQSCFECQKSDYIRILSTSPAISISLVPTKFFMPQTMAEHPKHKNQLTYGSHNIIMNKTVRIDSATILPIRVIVLVIPLHASCACLIKPTIKSNISSLNSKYKTNYLPIMVLVQFVCSK